MKKNHQDSGWFNTVLHNFLNCIVNLRFHSGLVSEIRRINTRVTTIAQGRQKYFDPAGGLNLNVGSSSDDLAYDTRSDALFYEEAVLVGIEGPKSKLMRLLMEGGSGLRVISVVGTGGVGKSALAKKVYDDASVKNHFKTHACIDFPQIFSKSITDEILKELIRQVFHETKEALLAEVDSKNKTQLKEVINQFLQEKRYVIVFDDVRRTQQWDAIKSAFSDNSNGSRLIVTTRDNAVASYFSIMEENVYRLHHLTPEQSKTLFCQKAFRGSQSPPPHLEETTNNIIKRCDGLSLAIKSVGEFLASKGNRLAKWQMLNRSLGNELESNNGSMNTILLISFNDLPYCLKLCLLYMAIYPEYHLIKCKSLIRLWMVEGFVNENEGQTVEEVAQGYLMELANKKLIQVVKRKENGNIRTWLKFISGGVG
ncbi:disease resistance RPM1-like [Olea europaea subsp. europaea]|uniref:Disease resistance RPM1-like n=1 Tax=Olea europaea subsp. europaea TaxID=158383 RepID=A0A8S0TJ22_OLEEU|nr:disease resistance RPM1-like [Olea europaea subsp. europaea]